jgi:hypothetical protein
MKTDEGAEVQIHAFSISVLGRGEWSGFTPPVAIRQEAGWVPQPVSFRIKKKSLTNG